jgi:rSAM/selenodomain-associated transferase 1
MNRACVLLARAPSAPGKTRLTSTLGRDAAIALRRALLLDTYDAVCAAGADVIVAFTPDDARDEVEMLLARSGTRCIPQSGHDLGARMHTATSDALARGAHHVVLVGSDLPSLPATHLTDAFRSLETHDVVLGPSADGGYYLVGMRQAEGRLFEGVTWGSASVLSETLATAKALNLSTARISPWFDVDTRDDLLRVQSDARPDAARHTRDWLARFRV